MTKHFEGRPDRLYYREVLYGKPVKRFEPAEKERAKHIQVLLIVYHVYLLYTGIVNSVPCVPAIYRYC